MSLIKWHLRRPKNEPEHDFFLALNVLKEDRFVLVGRLDPQEDILRLLVHTQEPQEDGSFKSIEREVAVIMRPGQDHNNAKIMAGRGAFGMGFDYRAVAIALHKRLFPMGIGSLRDSDNAEAWVDESALMLAKERLPKGAIAEVTEEEAAEGLGKLFGGN